MRKLFAALAVVAAMALPFGANMVAAQAGSDHAPHKAFVCKYVGTPGVDERLQTGQNPIDVDFHAIDEDPVVVGSYFADAQGRSFVLAIDVGQAEPDVSSCPPGDTPPPPTDVCPNLEGNQATVPDGYHVDNEGNCVPDATNPPPVDVCPNIEGNQETIPEGLVLNEQGNCVTPPTETPPPPPPSTPEPFIFSTCDTGTFIRFSGGLGNAYYSVDGVFTDVVITVDPTDIQLGSLPNGTVVTAAFNGGDVRTLTVSNDCPVVTPPPTNPPWTPTWTPHPPIPTHTNPPGGGDLAFTGADLGNWPAIGGALFLIGLLSAYWARKRSLS